MHVSVHVGVSVCADVGVDLQGQRVGMGDLGV